MSVDTNILDASTCRLGGYVCKYKHYRCFSLQTGRVCLQIQAFQILPLADWEGMSVDTNILDSSTCRLGGYVCRYKHSRYFRLQTGRACLKIQTFQMLPLADWEGISVDTNILDASTCRLGGYICRYKRYQYFHLQTGRVCLQIQTFQMLPLADWEGMSEDTNILDASTCRLGGYICRYKRYQYFHLQTGRVCLQIQTFQMLPLADWEDVSVDTNILDASTCRLGGYICRYKHSRCFHLQTGRVYLQIQTFQMLPLVDWEGISVDTNVINTSTCRLGGYVCRCKHSRYFRLQTGRACLKIQTFQMLPLVDWEGMSIDTNILDASACRLGGYVCKCKHSRCFHLQTGRVCLQIQTLSMLLLADWEGMSVDTNIIDASACRLGGYICRYKHSRCFHLQTGRVCLQIQTFQMLPPADWEGMSVNANILDASTCRLGGCVCRYKHYRCFCLQTGRVCLQIQTLSMLLLADWEGISVDTSILDASTCRLGGYICRYKRYQYFHLQTGRVCLQIQAFQMLPLVDWEGMSVDTNILDASTCRLGGYVCRYKHSRCFRLQTGRVCL